MSPSTASQGCRGVEVCRGLWESWPDLRARSVFRKSCCLRGVGLGFPATRAKCQFYLSGMRPDTKVCKVAVARDSQHEESGSLARTMQICMFSGEPSRTRTKLLPHFNTHSSWNMLIWGPHPLMPTKPAQDGRLLSNFGAGRLIYWKPKPEHIVGALLPTDTI